VLGAIGARVVDRELPVPTVHEQFDEHGRLSDEDLEAELLVSLTALVDAIGARAAQRRDAGEADPALA
jgi:hypothetical protein